MSDLESVTLALRCPRCGGNVEVQFTDWDHERAEHVETSYACPYCGQEHRFQAAGKVAWVTKRLVDSRQPEGRH